MHGWGSFPDLSCCVSRFQGFVQRRRDKILRGGISRAVISQSDGRDHDFMRKDLLSHQKAQARRPRKNNSPGRNRGC